MVIDLNDVTQWTWDQNIGTHRKVDNEVLRRTISSLMLSLRNDLSFTLDFDWGLMFLPHQIVSHRLKVEV